MSHTNTDLIPTEGIEALKKAKAEGFSEALQEYIISTNDAELIYRMAHDFKETDLERIEPYILNDTNKRYCLELAILKVERGVGTIDLLQEQVLNSGDGGIMLLFAADVADADTDLFEEAFKKHPDPKFLHLFENEMRLLGKHY